MSPDQHETDRIARRAASLLESGRVAGIENAICAAMDTLDLEDARRPSRAAVRAHCRAMSMQALGDDGYSARIASILRIAELFMEALAFIEPDARCLLVGRAAQGLIDGGVVLHIRLYTKTPIGDLANGLIAMEFAEPRIETVDMRHGRMNRLAFEEDGVEVIVSRCMPDWWGDRSTDLFTGKPVATLDFPGLQALIKAQDPESSG